MTQFVATDELVDFGADIKRSDLDALVAKHAQRTGVATDFLRAQIEAESNWNPKAVGAGTGRGNQSEGIAQILKSESSKAGIDPYDPDQAIGYMADRAAAALKQHDGDYREVAGQYHGWNERGPATRAYQNKVDASFEKRRSPRSGGIISAAYAEELPSSAGVKNVSYLATDEPVDFGQSDLLPTISSVGPAKKEEEAPGVVSSAGRGLTHGTIGLAEAVNLGGQFIAGRLGSKEGQAFFQSGAQFWEKIGKGYESPEVLKGNILDKPELLGKGAWWSYHVADIVPSFAAAMIPAAGAFKAIKVGGETLKWTPQVIARLARVGAAVTGGTAGGSLEGVQTYKTVLERGGSETEAATAGSMMALASAGLNALSVGSMFGAFKGRIMAFLVSGATEGLTEWAEEPTEGAILSSTSVAKPEDDPLTRAREGINVLPIAAVTGGVGGAATYQKPSEVTPQPETGDIPLSDIIPEAAPAAPVNRGVATAEDTGEAALFNIPPNDGGPPGGAPGARTYPSTDKDGRAYRPFESGSVIDAGEELDPFHTDRVYAPAGTPVARAPISLIPGAPVQFSTERGTQLDGQYAIVDAGSLIASHDTLLKQNPAYPQELQPRDRSRAASELQVARIANNLQPALLGESPLVSQGAPIIGDDGVVESGNARVIALTRAYRKDGANAYKQWLTANGEKFGLPAGAIDGVPNPVLVRVRRTPVNRAEFSRQANESSVAQMSPVELAKSDAERLSNLDDLTIDDSGDFLGASNRGFLRRFLGSLPVTEQAALVTEDGELSQSGYSRVRNAILARAYGNSPTLLRVVESLDDNLRNVTKALIKTAPMVAKARDSIKQGALHDRDITGHVVRAVEELSRLRAKGQTVGQMLAQAQMFRTDLTPEMLGPLQFMEQNARSPKAISAFIENYLTALQAVGSPNQASLLGEAAAPTVGTLIEEARKRTDEQIAGGLPEGTPAAAGPATGAVARAGEPGAVAVPGPAQLGAESRIRPSDAERPAQEPAQRPPTAEPQSRVAAEVKAARKTAKTPAEAGVSVSDIEAKATALGIEWDNHPAFMARTKELTGKEHLDDLNPSELQTMFDSLESGVDKDQVRPDLSPKGTTQARVVPESGVEKSTPAQKDDTGGAATPGTIQGEKPVESLPGDVDTELQDALADLGEWMDAHLPGKAAMVPMEARKALLPILTRFFAAAIKAGYKEFKTAARWVLEQIQKDAKLQALVDMLPEEDLKAAFKQAKESIRADTDSKRKPAGGEAKAGEEKAKAADEVQPVRAEKAGIASEIRKARDLPPEAAIISPIDRNASDQEKVAQLKKLSDVNAPIIRDLLKRVDARFDSSSKLSYKDPEMIAAKGSRASIRARKPWFRIEHVRDSLRFKSVTDDMAQLPAMLEMVRAAGFEIIKIDTAKLLAPAEYGWRIVVFDLRAPNGQLVEYYVPVPELEAAKKAGGHEIFEKWRSKDVSKLTTAQRVEMDKDLTESRRMHNKAWEAYLARTGQDESAVRASLMKLDSLSAETGTKSSLSSLPVTEVLSDQVPSTPLTAKKPSASSTNTRPKESTPTVGISEPPSSRSIIAETAPVDAAAHEAATSPLNDLSEPSREQIDANNYKLGHPRISGFELRIENPKGSVRKDKHNVPPKWRQEMKSHYGYFLRYDSKKAPIGPDKEWIDVFVKEVTPEDYEGDVYVIDQNKANGHFDEPKVMIGWDRFYSAKEGYLENHDKDWPRARIRSTTLTSIAGLKKWFAEGDTKKPFADWRETMTVEDPDFVNTFPMPIDSNILDETPYGEEQEGLKAIHEEQAAELVGYLSDTDAVRKAWEDGTTIKGTKPKTPSQAEKVRKQLQAEMDSLPEQYQDALAAYGTAFGMEAESRFDSLVHDEYERLKNGQQPLLIRTEKSKIGTDGIPLEQPESSQTGDGAKSAERQRADAAGVGAVGSGLAGRSQEDGSSGDLFGSSQGTSAVGEPDALGRPGGGAVSGPPGQRDPADVRHPDETLTPDSSGVVVSSPTNYTITPADQIGAGGPKAKARGNIAAIRIVKSIGDRHATPEEQAQLIKYVGWGGIKSIFDEGNQDWAPERAELKSLLTADEFEHARRSILDSHYTSETIVGGIYDAVKRLGFNGGRVLEPGMGIGHFFGLMPPEMRAHSALSGVELDTITGAIAKALYPLAYISAPRGFQEINVPEGHYDLAAGNPPFGNQSLFDENNKDISKFSIHNFFFAKSIKSLRPGGILSMVVSNYFMDARTSDARAWIADRAKLLGAIRLPNTAFKGNAGTEVTTDIIFLQKLSDEADTSNKDWVKVGEIPDPAGGEAMPLNTYFIEHPEMMLGTMKREGTMYAGGTPALIGTPGQDMGAALGVAVARLPEGVYQPIKRDVEQLTEDLVPDEVRVGGYFILPNGKIAQRTDDVMDKRQHVEVDVPEIARARIKGMAGVRDALRKLMRAELADDAKPRIEGLRRVLNVAYDAYTRKFGLLNSVGNRRAFEEDPDRPLLEALEKDYDSGLSKDAAKKQGVEPRKPSAKKADIFSKRVLAPYHAITHADTAKDALSASLAERGRVDLEYMAQIAGKPADEIKTELAGVIFEDPERGWVTADEFLSGNVKAKLAQAKKADNQANIAALEAVQPEDVEAADIPVNFGAHWIPAKDVDDFIESILKVRPRSIAFIAAAGRWSIDIPSRSTTEFTTEWGALLDKNEGWLANDIIEAMLNHKPVVVKINRGTGLDPNWVVLTEETAAARAKAEAIAEKFKEWIFLDQARRERLSKFYNDTFNTDVNREFDGSYLTLPGTNPNIILTENKKHSVARMVQTHNVLLDQVVGSGKTFTIAAGVMEMKRLGIIRKAMIVVPNHIVMQWRDEFYALYPNANILATTEADFTKENRQRLFARIATGDWDAVIVAHSSFGKLPMPKDEEQAILYEQVNDLTEAIKQIKEDRGDRHVLRDMEKFRDRLKDRLKAMAAASTKDKAGVDFSELGVDMLAVDELHEFKNLFYYSQMQGVSGLGNPAGSNKAFDLFVKARYIQKHAGRFVGATGTPISNSMVEMFTMQRYMDYDTLRARGIHHLDAWAGLHGDIKQIWEVHPSGNGYRLSNRIKFGRVAELVTQYRKFADILMLGDLKKAAKAQGKRYPVPKIKGGKPQIKVAPRSAEQVLFFGVPEFVRDEDGRIKFMREMDDGIVMSRDKWLTEHRMGGDQLERAWPKDKSGFAIIEEGTRPGAFFATAEEAQTEIERQRDEPMTVYNEGSILWKFENLRQLMKDSNNKINALSITNEARKSGLDYRLIDQNGADFAGSKINMAVDDTVTAYHKWHADLGTQLIFIDLSTPKGAIAEIQRPVVPEDTAAEGGEAEIDMDALLSTQARFSVYDDIKAKLIARGIPSADIAFIHDAKNREQKRKLFGRVNRGEVRILLGSTPKMGAGTNAQKRLVALRHLDAPWRPSDIEQREGRIIRQGNELYERDPEGFEVEIVRYSTEKSYDTRMWQIIEHKANVNTQVRAGQIKDMSMLEDVGAEAANAADMKAAASGNPLLEQEIKLREAVRKLELASDSHRRSRFGLQKKIAQLEKMPAVRGEAKDKLKQFQAAATAKPEKGFLFKAVDGRAIAEYTDLNDPVLTAMKAAIETPGSEIPVGAYRGLHIFIRHNPNLGAVMVYAAPNKDEGRARGVTEYGKDDKFSAAGLIQRLDHFIDRIDNEIADIDRSLVSDAADIKNARASMVGDFPQAQELTETRTKHIGVLQKLQESGGAIELTPEMRVELDAERGRRRVLRPLDKIVSTDWQQALGKYSRGGQRVAQTDTPAFKKWFGDSKVVDADDKPLVVYHGTWTDFSEFDRHHATNKFGRDAQRTDAIGSWFTSSPESAGRGYGPAVMPVYISVKNPLVFTGSDANPQEAAKQLWKAVDAAGGADAFRKQAMAEGYDGVAIKGDLLDHLPGDVYVAFRPEQIKSAIGNRGTFDPANPDITYSREGGSGITLAHLQDEVKRLAGGFAGIDFVVTNRVDQWPAELVAQIKRDKAEGVVAAFHEGKVYLAAENMPSVEAVGEKMLHEAEHFGLRGMFGAELDPVLLQIRNDSIKVQIAAAKLRARYKDLTPAGAVEEVLAEMAERGERPVFMQKIVAFVRGWLRKHGFKMKFSDADVLALVDRALKYKAGGRGVGTAFSQTAQTATAAFKKWFGDSKVVDAQGNPLVVYHGTTGDITAFDLNHPNRMDTGWLGTGVYLTTTPSLAHSYSIMKTGDAEPNVMPLYAKLENPYYAASKDKERFMLLSHTQGKEAGRAEADRWTQELRNKGHDGVILEYKAAEVGESNVTTEMVVFDTAGVKSAIGNRGTFDPGNHDIRYSRATAINTALARPRGGILDTALRVPTQALRLDRITSGTYDYLLTLLGGFIPEKVKAGIVSDYGVPEAVLDRRAEMFGHMRKGLRETESTLQRLTMLTRAESRVAYEWLTNRNADELLNALPQDSRQTLLDLKKLISSLGTEAVRLGQLSDDAYKANDMAYLHRSYRKYDLEATEAERAQRARAVTILGDQYKGRGIVDKTTMNKVGTPDFWEKKLKAGKADTALKGQEFIRLEKRRNRGEGVGTLPGVVESDQLGKIVEAHYWPAGEALPARYEEWHKAGTWKVRDVQGDKVIMWRDFTKEERVRMGEIDEARYAIAKTLHQMLHDLEAGRYLEWLANTQAHKEPQGQVVSTSESLSTSYAPGTWVQVPDTTVPGTKVRKYGKLAGLYLPGPVWNDVRQVVNHSYKPLGETFAMVLKAWKVSKTALSPAVHANNVMANVVMADWHDVRARHLVKALGIMVNSTNAANKAVLDHFEDAGGTQGMYVLNEIQREQLAPIMDQLRREIAATDEAGGLARAASVLQLMLSGRLKDAMAAATQTKTIGLISKAAGKMIDFYQAEDTVFRLAAFIKAKEEGQTDAQAGKFARKSFLDYQINAPWIQMMRQTAFPFVAFTYRALPMLIETAARKPWKFMKLGLVLGIANAMGYAFSGGDEDKERKLLPEEKAGRVLGFISPKLIRMPWNDKYDQPVFMDIRRFVPVGDVFDLGQTHAAMPIMPMAIPGGPLAVLAEILFNKSQFTGREITQETDTAFETAKNVANHLYKAMTPNFPVLPGSYSFTSILNAGKGKTDAFGREQGAGQALLSSIGIKVGSYAPDVLRQQLMGNYRAKDAELNANIRRLIREYQRKGLTEAEFKAKIADQTAKRRKLMEGVREKVQ